MSVERRVSVIEEAKGYVTKDRNTSYGEPEDNFSRIAGIWNAQGVTVDGRPCNAADVALMMLGMKLARLSHNPSHRDSWVDAIGYAACGADVALSEESFKEKVNTWVRDSGWKPGDKANNDEVRMRIEQERLDTGWISDNRCGAMRFDHVAHGYGPDIKRDDKEQAAYWCDGYVTPERKAQQAKDIDTIKRVDAKLRRDRNVCDGEGIHQGCGPMCEVTEIRT